MMQRLVSAMLLGAAAARLVTPAQLPPVVILPGFGNDAVDYISPLKQPEEVGLCSVLRRRGFTDVSVVPVQRADWLRVALGLFDPRFWKGEALPSGPSFSWYLQRARLTVEEAEARSGGAKVLLVGHSAGGWLARALLADGAWEGEAAAAGESEGGARRAGELVCALVTLGSPHFPPPEGTPDMTRGVLTAVDAAFPGAHLAQREGISYVTVGADSIVGEKRPPKGAEPAGADAVYARRGEGSAAAVAYNSYEMVCGEGAVTGDGVVPLQSSHLEGATQLTLKGVLHSINEAGTTLPTDRWYGAEEVVDQWLSPLLRELEPERSPLEQLLEMMPTLPSMPSLPGRPAQ